MIIKGGLPFSSKYLKTRVDWVYNIVAGGENASEKIVT